MNQRESDYDGPWLVTEERARRALVRPGERRGADRHPGSATAASRSAATCRRARIAAVLPRNRRPALPLTSRGEPQLGDASFPARAAVRDAGAVRAADSGAAGPGRGRGRAARADRPLPPPRDRPVRRGALRRRVEAAAAPAAPHGHAAPHGPPRTVRHRPPRGDQRPVRRGSAGATGDRPIRGRYRRPPTSTSHGTPTRGLRGWAGLRLPTEDEWQVAAEAGLLERLEPLVWNLTESEHTDGRTRFGILKGGVRFPSQRLRLVPRRRPAAAASLGEAASPWRPSHPIDLARLPLRGRPTPLGVRA